MVYQRCRERGCTKKDCGHEWFIAKMWQRDRARGPASRFAFLLEPHEALPINKTEARELEGRVLTWLKRGRPLPATPTAAPPATRTTIAQACEAYWDAHGSKLNGNGDRGHLDRIIAACGPQPVEDLLDRRTLRDVLDPISEDYPIAANRLRARWSHLLHWCQVEYRFAGPSPFYHRTLNPQGIKKNPEGPRRRRLTDDEDRAIEQACRALADGGMMLGRYYCALDAGLRKGEMLALTRKDLGRDPQTGMLTMTVRWTTSKTSKERIVPVMSARLETFIKRRFDRIAAFVFGQLDGTRVDSFRVDWENVLLAAGLLKGGYVEGTWQWDDAADADLHWHDLRHECGSRLAEGRPPKQAPMPLMELKELLGHSSLATTQKYLNPTLSSMAANMRRIFKARGL